MSRFVCLRTRFLVAALGMSLAPPVVLAQGSGALLEEVVVTARKREESLQDAPIAVSAFTGAALEFRGVTSIDKLDEFTPNLVLNKSPTNSGVTNAAVFIRGIGQNDFVPVIDPGVGIYVDGVYLGRSVGGVLDLVDVERVEVLRGPQGTLFGRNTIGGAISLTTKKPEDELSGKLDIKTGTDSLLNVRGNINLPLADNLFTRFSFGTFNQDGYVERVSDGLELGNDDTITARAAVRWLVNEDVTVDWTVDYSRDRENGPPIVTTGIQPFNLGLFGPGGAPSQTLAQNTIVAQLATGSPVGPFADLTTTPPGLFGTACFTPPTNGNPACFNRDFIDDGSKDTNFGTDPSFADLDIWGTALTIDWNLPGSLEAKSITSFRTMDGEFFQDQDGSPLAVSQLIDIFKQEQVTQELQLLGTSFDDRLDWILGLYYFHEEGKNINPVRFTVVHVQSGGFFEFDSWAAFAQGTWHVTDQLDLTFGVRYTEDTRDYLPDQFFEALPVGPLPLNCPPSGGAFDPTQPVCGVGDRVLPFETETQKTKEAVPMVNLSYRWWEGLMTYFTYSEGFKSGGFTQRIFPPEPSLPSFDPEFVESFELGFKYEGWDNRLRFNFAAYYTDYTDLQLLVADPSRLGPFVSNAGDAEIKGVEMELFLTPAEGWYISGSAGLTDADRTELGGGVEGLTLDSRFEHISEWTANLQLYKEIPLGELGMVTPRFEWSFRTEYGTNSNNVPRDGAPLGPPGTPFAGTSLAFGAPNPALLEDDLHLIHLSLRWQVAATGLTLAGGVDNVTDEEFRTFGNFQDNFGWTNEAFDRGRQWYLQATYTF